MTPMPLSKNWWCCVSMTWLVAHISGFSPSQQSPSTQSWCRPGKSEPTARERHITWYHWELQKVKITVGKTCSISSKRKQTSEFVISVIHHKSSGVCTWNSGGWVPGDLTALVSWTRQQRSWGLRGRLLWHGNGWRWQHQGWSLWIDTWVFRPSPFTLLLMLKHSVITF